MVLRHVAQPQLGLKSLLWWYHSNQTHLKQPSRVWCCTVSTPHTPAISCCPPHLFSLKVISIPGMTLQTSVYKWAPCGLQPTSRCESAPASTLMDVWESERGPRQTRLSVRVIIVHTQNDSQWKRSRGWRGQMLSESGDLTVFSMMYGERLFLEILDHPPSH